MELTRIRVFPLKGFVLRATASITVDETLVIKGLKIVLMRDGLRVTWPARRAEDGSYVNIVEPVTTAKFKPFEQAILKAYYEATKSAGDGESYQGPQV